MHYSKQNFPAVLLHCCHGFADMLLAEGQLLIKNNNGPEEMPNGGPHMLLLHYCRLALHWEGPKSEYHWSVQAEAHELPHGLLYVPEPLQSVDAMVARATARTAIDLTLRLLAPLFIRTILTWTQLHVPHSMEPWSQSMMSALASTALLQLQLCDRT